MLRKSLYQLGALTLAMGTAMSAQAETVSSVAIASNTYNAGQTITITVGYTGNVDVDTTGGTPSIPLTIDTNTAPVGVQAVYSGGTGTNSLTFDYVVDPDLNDTNGITLDSNIFENGGDITDTVGGAQSGLALSAFDASGVLVDSNTAPVVTSVAVPANATYTAGQDLDFTVNFDENVDVDTGGGTPSLALTIGSASVNANYVSGSGSGALLFRYTVQPGDVDADGIAVGALSLNSGTIEDSVDNTANLTLNSVGDTSAVLVDAPVAVSSVTVPAAGDYATGSNLDFVVNFNANVNVTGTPRLALTVGSATLYADYLSGTGSSALTFRYTVGLGDFDNNGIAISGSNIDLNGGAIAGAGGPAALTLNSVASPAGINVNFASGASATGVPVNSPLMLLMMMLGMGWLVRRKMQA
ncbi:MAG: hypothetical protein OIF38_10580 [Cellvibrionaceae bacterium]|nr:hypothetical protein [Cellvibrionaceae bacterium]